MNFDICLVEPCKTTNCAVVVKSLRTVRFGKKFCLAPSRKGIETKRVQAAVDSYNNLRAVNVAQFPAKRTTAQKEAAKIYADAFKKAYSAVLEVAGAKVVVDSSKYPLHGLFLSSLPEIDLKVELLVRDPRAVAHSWQRKRLRPEVHWEKREMPRHAIARSAIAWNLSNSLTEKLDNENRVFRTQKYEDFTDKPLEQLREIAEFCLNTPTEINQSIFSAAASVRSHTIAGNPVRLADQAITVKQDEKWRNEMPFYKKVQIDLLCARGMHKYEYPLFS